MYRLLAVIIILFIANSSAESSILLDRVVAVIDKDVITWSEMYKAMGFEYESRVRGLTPAEKEKFFQSVQNEFIDKLINIRLQIEEAKKAGFSASDAEAKAAIDDIRNHYGLSEDQFKNELKKQGFAYEDYVNKIKDQILVNKVVHNEVRSKIVISDSEIDNYIRENKDELPMNLTYKLFQIQFKNPDNEEDKARINELLMEIKAKYDKGIDLHKILSDLKSNSFLIFSGETDFIRANDMREDLLKAIKYLKVGSLSDPVYASDGVFLIKVIKKDAPEKVEDLRDNIRKMLTEKRLDDRYRLWVKRLRQRSFIEIKL